MAGGDLVRIDEIEQRFTHAEFFKWVGVRNWIKWKDNNGD